ncbi:MAG: DUF1911 domain-containing protein [Burkholderiales bacterium]|nr:DUF1911 domain-containing protein [Burkholderiales bacterium]
MEFHNKRRQQFLDETRYLTQVARLPESIAYFAANPLGSGSTALHRDMLARLTSAEERMDLIFLQYTAGDSIEPLRRELEEVIAAYERYGELLWRYRKDRNEVVFEFTSLDDYCQLMQLIGLCFLLHRRDLLPRVAALQDGLDAVGQDGEGNGGTDTLYEEFMAHAVGGAARYNTDWLCCSKPYQPLFRALTETTPERRLIEIDRFLKRWYKDLAGTGWHDSHKPDAQGNQGGYYGYWSFEAGAAVLLLGIEDDASLHQYLYYPKDLVAWSRAHAALSDTRSPQAALRLRCEAGQPCPREGWWATPAQAHSRRRFRLGEPMPDLHTDYGTTIWQWEEDPS